VPLVLYIKGSTSVLYLRIAWCRSQHTNSRQGEEETQLGAER
jgi:hypothetical protein